MRLTFKWQATFLAPIVAVILGAGLLLLDPSLMQTLRNTAFDQYQRLHPRTYTPAPVRIIDIDEASLAKFGQWPWPRTRLAQMVTRLQRAQAAAIGFDVVFPEPDRTSPEAILDLWQVSPDVRRQLQHLPDHDEALAKALRQGGVVLGLALERRGVPSALPPQDFRYINRGESPLPFVSPFAGVISSLPILNSAAAGNGALTFIPDNDGVLRRVPMVFRLNDTLVPSLAAEMLRVGQGAKNYMVHTAAEQGVGIAEIRIGNISVPTTASGEAWIYFTPPTPERTIPAWKILEGKIPDAQLQNQLFLIGSSAQGLMDLRFSPLGGIIPGVEAHAQMLEQVLTDNFLYRPGWATAIEALTIVIGGLLLGTLALTTGALISAAATLIALALIVWGGWFAFTEHQLLLDPVTPALGVFIAFLLSSIAQHFSSEKRQRWVKAAFSRYVSPNLVSYIVDHPDELELGGRRQECSFIFTDLADFTGLMEKIDPGEAVALLNVYLDEMIAIAFRYQGTLDRIVGDAVAIMFSAPVPQSDHQSRALDCALEMQRYASRYSDEIKSRGIAFGHTRIGVHSGEVIVGNFGGSTIFDYRALGDPVNTASRLESVNKHLGTRVCVSEATLAGCPDAKVRPVGKLALKGKSRPLRVFQPLNDGLDTLEVRDEAYETAYTLMADNKAGALAAFSLLALSRPNDALVRLHLHRLQQGQTGDLIVMSEK